MELSSAFLAVVELSALRIGKCEAWSHSNMRGPRDSLVSPMWFCLELKSGNIICLQCHIH